MGDAVERQPGNMWQRASRGPQRARSPLLSEEEEEAWRGDRTHRSPYPRALADLRGDPHSYVTVADRSERQTLAAGPRGWGRHRPRKHGAEGPLGQPLCVQRKPRSRTVRSPQHPLQPRGKPAEEPRLTESDSMSAASSSEQQSSSADQYLQVCSRHSSRRSAGQAGGRTAVSRLELAVGLNDLICSDV